MDRLDRPTGPRLSARWRRAYRRKGRRLLVLLAVFITGWVAVVWWALKPWF